MNVPDDGWRRLSPRMLLIHPVIELVRSIPLLFGALVAGASTGSGEYWSLAIAAAVIAFSVSRWFTTRYRISQDQIQLRQGLLRRRTVNARLDRVRTVDVTAHLLHRALGVSRVVIGTGTSDRRRPEGLTLDGVDVADATRLRAELLHRAPTPPSTPGHPSPREQDLAVFDPRWVRFAPFNLSGAVTALAIAGFAVRIVTDAHVNVGKIGFVRDTTDEIRSASLVAVAAVFLLLAAFLIAITSTAGYVLAFWGFHLTRHEGGSLHVSRGLITTRNTSIEKRRLRGVELSEPLLLRAVGGARCLAVATGLRVGRGAERGGSILLPPAPSWDATRVACAVLEADGPFQAQLRGHSGAARRRRYLRSVGLTTLALAIVLPLGMVEDWTPKLILLALLLLPAAALAEDRFRSLGHSLIGGHLVTRSGCLVRRRVAVEATGVIGWTIRRTFFQRRSGLSTITAATAAGRQGYKIIDIELDTAEDLIAACSPGLLDPIRC